MKKYNALISMGLIVAFSSEAVVSDTSSAGFVPELSARGAAMLLVETDRAAAIASIATRVPERNREDFVAELAQKQNHELIDLLSGQGDASIRSFSTSEDFNSMVYSALEEPCRILDTRIYAEMGGGTTPVPINAGVAREVWGINIGGQGGNPECAATLLGKSAIMISLTAVAPGFPATTFPTTSYGTLLNGALMVEPDWKPIAESTPGNYLQFTFDGGIFNQAASITWDSATHLTSTLAVVNTSSSGYPKAVLYAGGTSHFVMDAVGYFNKPAICPNSEHTFLAGSCWSPPQEETNWFFAGSNCALAGGRLPPASLINALIMAGELPDTTLWADGYYSNGVDFFGQATSSVLQMSGLTTDLHPYRCIFSPLIDAGTATP